MRTFFHPDQRLHDPQQFMRVGRIARPTDVPSRCDVLLATLEARGLAPTAPEPAGLGPALAVHSPDYLDFLATIYEGWSALPDAGPEVLPNLSPYWNARPGETRQPCRPESLVARAGHYLGDLSVPIGPHSWQSILAASHCAAAAADAVLSGETSAYALCRPSGHHARRDRASGFCYVNNAAIAAQRLRSHYDRVAVLDIDAHHGDGTQEIFYARDDVQTISIHADPNVYYPFYTGYPEERGVAAGEGRNLNLPLPAGASDAEYHAAIDRALEEATTFGAQALVLSLGFDGHREDPIGLLDISTRAFQGVGERVRSIDLPTVIIQEGGYQTSVIGTCLDEFLGGFGAY